MLASVTTVYKKVMNPVQFNPLYISLVSSVCLLILMIMTGQLPMMETISNLGSFQSAELLGHKLPSVIVIGVKKCGTGAVMQQLGIHPQVSMVRTAHCQAQVPNTRNKNPVDLG